MELQFSDCEEELELELELELDDAAKDTWEPKVVDVSGSARVATSMNLEEVAL